MTMAMTKPVAGLIAKDLLAVARVDPVAVTVTNPVVTDETDSAITTGRHRHAGTRPMAETVAVGAGARLSGHEPVHPFMDIGRLEREISTLDTEIHALQTLVGSHNIV